MFQTSRDADQASKHLVCLDLVEPEADQARVDRCRRLLTYARCAGWAITHLHPKTAGARPARPLPGLAPLPCEPVLYRSGASAFSNRTFRRVVREQAEGEMVILSLSLSSACLGTALFAYDVGMPVILVRDALSMSAADGLEAIETVASSIIEPFVEIAPVDDLIEPRRGLRLVVG